MAKNKFIDQRFMPNGKTSNLSLTNKLNLKKYIKQVVEDGNLAGGVTDTTYSELVSLINTSQLVAGKYYNITDFRTCYDQPDFDVNGNPVTASETYKQAEISPIIVVAINSNSISSYAYQPEYPNDIIQYDYSFNQTETMGGDAYGRITERIDEYGNRTDYDHRTILYKRYRTYYYDTDNPLTGTITINGTITALGTDTLFESELNIGDIIVVNFKNYKVINIISDTQIEIEGDIIESVGNTFYFKGQPQIDGEESNIPYTHTQMTDPPVNNNDEALITDFIMDGIVKPSDAYFGIDSEYFTNLYPGMFVMVAKDIDIDYFKINGKIGANGSGNVDTYMYDTNYDGQDYTAYVKRVYNAGDPSINQIIIVNTDGTGITQDYDFSTEDDYHELTGLNSVDELHYLLLSRNNPDDKIDDSTIDSIVEAYLAINNNNNINTLLTGLNSDYQNITSLVSDLFLFNDVDDGIPGSIDDGGEDMYNGANYIYTDRTAKWRCYEWKKNNIKNDIYREVTTFRFEDELELDGQVTSISNYIGDYSKYYLNTNLSVSNFLLPNITFGLYSYGNTLGDRCFNVGTYNWFNRNQISGTFQRNTIKRGFYANIIGEYFTDNEIYAYCWRNKIGEGFENNFLGGSDFQNNVINNGFNNNYICISDDFYKNWISNGFNNNVVIFIFYGNHIGNAYNDNNIYQAFFDNNIGEYFENNTIGDFDNIGEGEFTNNKIGNNFKGNSTVGQFSQNQIGNDFVSNQVADYFYSNTIRNNFFANDISYSFAYNQIADSFSNNVIANDFGFGGGNSRGNVIGNNFQGNNIGEYFYDNNVKDYFSSNNIGDSFVNNNVSFNFDSNNIGYNFQNNDIKVSVIGTDFGSEQGQLSTVINVNSPNGVDNTYPNVSQFSTSGIGENSTFDIDVSGGVVNTVTINNVGYGYVNGDTILINGSNFGGVDGIDDLTLQVDSPTTTIYVTDATSCTIFYDANPSLVLSYVDSLGVLNVVLPTSQS